MIGSLDFVHEQNHDPSHSRAHLNLMKERFSQNSSVKTSIKTAPSDPLACQRSLYYQPKQCTIIEKSLKIPIHLDCLMPPKMGNLMTPACSGQNMKY